MVGVRTFVAPSATAAEPLPLLVFQAPELWGERVTERAGSAASGGTIRWLALGSALGAGAGTEDREVGALDEVLEDLRRAAPACRREEQAPGRWAFGVVSALAAVGAFALVAVAALAGPAEGRAGGPPEARAALVTSAAPARGAAAPGAAPAEAEPAWAELETCREVVEPKDLGDDEPWMAELPDREPVARNANGPQAPAGPEPRARRRGPRGLAAARSVASAADDELAPALVYELRASRNVEPPAEMVLSRDELLLPPTLAGSELRAGLRRVAPLVRNCVAEGPRTTEVGLTISGATGRVEAVRLGGAFAGSPEEACVVRALGRARFPRFAEPTHEVASYPLVLR